MSQYSIIALCRPALAAGFRLAGVPTLEASDGQTVSAICSDRERMKSVGLILIEEDLLAALNAEQGHLLAHQPLPVFVPFPGQAWQSERGRAESYITEILRQAIGYRVRLQ